MSSRSSSHASLTRNDEPLLPLSFASDHKPSIRVRALLRRHCTFKRVLIWAVSSLALVAVILYSTKDVSIYDVASHHLGKPESSSDGHQSPATESSQDAQNADDKGDAAPEEDNPDPIVVVAPGEGDDMMADEEEEDDEDEDSLSAEDLEAKKQYQDDLKRMPWLRFKQYVPERTPSQLCSILPFFSAFFFFLWSGRKRRK